jgi:hypothetical protein
MALNKSKQDFSPHHLLSVSRMDLDMGEDKLPGDLLCCPPYCQGKKTYILGNSAFFALSSSDSQAISIPRSINSSLVGGF